MPRDAEPSSSTGESLRELASLQKAQVSVLFFLLSLLIHQTLLGHNIQDPYISKDSVNLGQDVSHNNMLHQNLL